MTYLLSAAAADALDALADARAGRVSAGPVARPSADALDALADALDALADAALDALGESDALPYGPDALADARDALAALADLADARPYALPYGAALSAAAWRAAGPVRAAWGPGAALVDLAGSARRTTTALRLAALAYA